MGLLIIALFARWWILLIIAFPQRRFPLSLKTNDSIRIYQINISKIGISEDIKERNQFLSNYYITRPVVASDGSYAGYVKTDSVAPDKNEWKISLKNDTEIHCEQSVYPYVSGDGSTIAYLIGNSQNKNLELKIFDSKGELIKSAKIFGNNVSSVAISDNGFIAVPSCEGNECRILLFNNLGDIQFSKRIEKNGFNPYYIFISSTGDYTGLISSKNIEENNQIVVYDKKGDIISSIDNIKMAWKLFFLSGKRLFIISSSLQLYDLEKKKSIWNTSNNFLFIEFSSIINISDNYIAFIASKDQQRKDGTGSKWIINVMDLRNGEIIQQKELEGFHKYNGENPLKLIDKNTLFVYTPEGDIFEIKITTM